MINPFAALAFQLARIGAANATAGLEAAVTIGQRLPAFAALGRGPVDPEVTLAVAEKLKAMAEGQADAAVLAGRVWIEAVTGRIHPAEMPQRLVAITEAGLAPARKAVRANARRLTRAARRGRGG